MNTVPRLRPLALTRSYCEVCEQEFVPQTIDEDDIVCPSCNAEIGTRRGVTRWIEEDERRRRPALLTRKVKAAPIDYQTELLRQGGACAICGTRPRSTSLVIDHNHRTGEFRALLCGECNKGLGALGDHPEILRRAAQYARAARLLRLLPSTA